jgi:hypothetical protein
MRSLVHVSFAVRAGVPPFKQAAGHAMAYRFRDSEFMSAREKRLVLKSWVRFVKNGLRFEDFSDRLYKHLTLHCSFIAHYDRRGFYDTYFNRGEDTVLFLSQFSGKCRSVEYGGAQWLGGDCGDLNCAMADAADPHIPSLIEAALDRQRDTDISAAEELLAKHGIEFKLP